MSVVLIKIRHACQKLGISRSTIGRWANDPCLNFPKFITIRRQHHLDEAKLDAWIEAQAEIEVCVEQVPKRERVRL